MLDACGKPAGRRGLMRIEAHRAVGAVIWFCYLVAVLMLGVAKKDLLQCHQFGDSNIASLNLCHHSKSGSGTPDINTHS